LVIAEVVPFTLELQKRFDEQPSFSDITALDCRSMLQDGILKVVQGYTTMDEVLQAAS
jgi:type II secretory ATPase GspE/PulE/Tfp pilus assembly ATPase PilB-like protein